MRGQRQGGHTRRPKERPHLDSDKVLEVARSIRDRHNTDSRIMLVRNSTRPMAMAGVVEGACQRINAASVMDSATGLSSARREVERAGDEEDVVVEEEEVAVVVVEAKAKVKVSVLLWLSRGQRR